MFGLALAITHDRDSAEEAAQDTFVKAWRYAASYDPRRGSPAAWLLSIARNTAIDEARARTRRPDRARLELSDEIRGADGVDSSYENLAPFADALSDLPDHQRDVLMACVYRGMTTREIADAWQLPIGTVKTRLRLALSRLRHSLVEVAQ